MVLVVVDVCLYNLSGYSRHSVAIHRSLRSPPDTAEPEESQCNNVGARRAPARTSGVSRSRSSDRRAKRQERDIRHQPPPCQLPAVRVGGENDLNS